METVQEVARQETLIVRRRGSRDVALIPASELAGLVDTAHLLRFAAERAAFVEGSTPRGAKEIETRNDYGITARDAR